jgi:hypothetical protein
MRFSKTALSFGFLYPRAGISTSRDRHRGPEFLRDFLGDICPNIVARGVAHHTSYNSTIRGAMQLGIQVSGLAIVRTKGLANFLHKRVFAARRKRLVRTAHRRGNAEDRGERFYVLGCEVLTYRVGIIADAALLDLEQSTPAEIRVFFGEMSRIGQGRIRISSPCGHE